MRSAAVTAIAVAAAVASLTGCSSAGSAPDGQPPALPTSTPTPVATAFSTEVPQQAATIPPVRRAPAPTRIVVDHDGISAPVRPEGVDRTGAMGLPPDPATAGWYRFGAAPSSSEGSVVLAAHVDAVGYGIGPFARLRDVPRRDDGHPHRRCRYRHPVADRLRQHAREAGAPLGRRVPRRRTAPTGPGHVRRPVRHEPPDTTRATSSSPRHRSDRGDRRPPTIRSWSTTTAPATGRRDDHPPGRRRTLGRVPRRGRARPARRLRTLVVAGVLVGPARPGGPGRRGGRHAAGLREGLAAEHELRPRPGARSAPGWSASPATASPTP